MPVDKFGRSLHSSRYTTIVNESNVDGFVKSDGTIPFADNLNMNGNKIQNLSAPTDAQDAVSKLYVDKPLSTVYPPTNYTGPEHVSWAQAVGLAQDAAFSSPVNKPVISIWAEKKEI